MCVCLFFNLVFMVSFIFFLVAIYCLLPFQHINDISIEWNEINLNPSNWASSIIVVPKNLSVVPDDSFQALCSGLGALSFLIWYPAQRHVLEGPFSGCEDWLLTPLEPQRAQELSLSTVRRMRNSHSVPVPCMSLSCPFLCSQFTLTSLPCICISMYTKGIQMCTVHNTILAGLSSLYRFLLTNTLLNWAQHLKNSS